MNKIETLVYFIALLHIKNELIRTLVIYYAPTFLKPHFGSVWLLFKVEHSIVTFYSPIDHDRTAVLILILPVPLRFVFIMLKIVT